MRRSLLLSTNTASPGADPVRPRQLFRPRGIPKPKVGFITPNLLIGGVEHWFLGVLRQTSEYIDWAVVVVNPTAIEPEMRMRTEEFASVGEGEHAIPQLLIWADVIVAWGIADLSRLLSKFSGPVVIVSHGCCDWTKHFVAGCRDVATHLVAVSEAAATVFSGRTATVIPNGVDARRCRPTRPREEQRQEWGLQSSEIAVGFVGRLSPEKNPLAVSRAVANLGQGYRAVYVGKGYGVDLRPDALRLTPDAIFVPPIFQVGNAYHALDCVVMASPSEGFPMVLVEALLAGVPVVATRVGVLPELESRHGVRLVTVPINPSPLQLANAVRTSISAQQLPLVKRLRGIVGIEYSEERMGKRWTDYLLEVAESSTLTPIPTNTCSTNPAPRSRP